MKILIATGLYAPDIGGPATYTETLEKHLPRKGYDLQVVPFSSVRQYPKVIRHLFYFFKVWRGAKEMDMVYALDPISVGLPALLAAKLRRKKFILRLGGDYAWEQGRVRFGVTDTLDAFSEKINTASFPVRVLSWLQTFVARRALVVVAPSQYLKNIIKTWGVKSDQVEVIYSSLSPLNPTSTKAETRSAYRSGSPLVVTSARLVPWKGMESLIKVIKKLTRNYPNITLLIAGDGPEKEKLESQIKNLNLENTVRLLGRLNKTELANVKNAGDVFVLNTAYEGLSHELLEVMDLGVPIVTTTAGGNTELLTDGRDALLVAFDDLDKLETAIDKILKSPVLANSLTEAAQVRSELFAEKVVVNKLDSLLKNIYAN